MSLLSELDVDFPSHLASDDEAGDPNNHKEHQVDRTQQFRREMKAMLYGFGDVKEPREDTLGTLCEMVNEYVVAVVKEAVALNVNKKLSLDDIYFLIRRDSKKFVRVRELLFMNEELKRARKDFENVEDRSW